MQHLLAWGKFLETGLFLCLSLSVLGLASIAANEPANSIQSLTEIDESYKRLQECSYGVFVGVNHFDDSEHIPTLQYAEADATALRDCFVNDLHLLKRENTRLLVSSATDTHFFPNRGNVLAALTWAANNARREGIIVIQISTHGLDGCVLVQDTHLAYQDKSSLSGADLDDLLRGSDCKRQLRIVDACRENPPKTGEKSIGTAIPLVEEIKESEGYWTLSSCSPNQVSYEMDDQQHGAFTHFLLKGLHGEAPPDDKNFLRINTLSKWVSNQVHEWSTGKRGKAQTPTLTQKDITDDLPLAYLYDLRKAEEMRRKLRDRKELLPWEREKICASLRIGSTTAPNNARMVQEYLDGKISLRRLKNILGIQTDPREQLASAIKLFIGSSDVDVDVDQAKNQFMETWDSDDAVCKGWEAWLKYGGLCEIAKDIEGASQIAKEVLPKLEKLAETDVEASFILAQLYDEGIGIFRMKDQSSQYLLENLKLTKAYKDKARKLMRKAAGQGHVFAKHMLGRYLEKRPGYDPTERDDVESFESYQELAEQGLTWSMFRLGVCYLMGRGTEPNKELAFNEFDRAFKKGNYHTRVILAKMYFDGVYSDRDNGIRVLEPDPEKGLQCLRDAAEKEYTPAMVQLADCLLEQATSVNDATTTQKLRQAIDLLKAAAKKGSSDAQVKCAVIFLDHSPEAAYEYLESSSPSRANEVVRDFLLAAMRLGNPEAGPLFERLVKEQAAANSSQPVSGSTSPRK